jgi:hypothetical protein
MMEKLKVKGHFDEIFSIDIDGWCYGVQNYPGELFPGLVHAVIRELAPTFRGALEHNFVFDILDVSKRISRAAKFLVHEKEICFAILAHLPNPTTLEEEAQYTLAHVIDQVEQHYGGALTRLQKKWAWEREQQAA